MRFQHLMSLYGMTRIPSNRRAGIAARQALEQFLMTARQRRHMEWHARMAEQHQQQYQAVYDSTPSELYENQMPEIILGIKRLFENSQHAHLNLPGITEEQLTNLCSTWLISQDSTRQ